MAGANAECLEGVDSYRAVETPANARLIFVGDIHGCYDELLELLARVVPAPQDLVVSVGDIVTKGPSVARCLDFWRERGYFAVAGNNELKVLDRATPFRRLFARDETVRRGDLLRYIRSWPLVLDFPSRNVAAVHGGFLPGMRVMPADIERERDVIPRLRWIRKKNGHWTYVPKNSKRDGDVLWAEKWKGERFVLYGHTPVREPKRDRMALGLDTGCVYGGMLTAAILANGEWTTVSVKARRKYAE